MMRLLKIELLKLLPYRTFKILFGLFLAFMGLTLFAGKNVGGEDAVLTSDQVLGFPNIWNYYTFYACFFNIILAILIIFITCNEYTYRTMRQNVIDGLSRTEAVTGKILLIILLAIISTLFLLISGLIAGYLYSIDAGRTNMFGHIQFVGAYFIQTLGVMAMGYLFAIIFKRTGLAVIIFLIFLFPVDLILREAILPDGSGDYLPVANYFLKMSPFPLNHILSRGEELPPSTPSSLAITMGAAYAILFLLISWLIIKRRDL